MAANPINLAELEPQETSSWTTDRSGAGREVGELTLKAVEWIQASWAGRGDTERGRPLAFNVPGTRKPDERGKLTVDKDSQASVLVRALYAGSKRANLGVAIKVEDAGKSEDGTTVPKGHLRIRFVAKPRKVFTKKSSE